VRNLNGHSHWPTVKEDAQMFNSPIIRKIKIKATMKYHFTPVKRIISKRQNTKKS
jgi:hypothetical protein